MSKAASRTSQTQKALRGKGKEKEEPHALQRLWSILKLWVTHPQKKGLHTHIYTQAHTHTHAHKSAPNKHTSPPN